MRKWIVWVVSLGMIVAGLYPIYAQDTPKIVGVDVYLRATQEFKDQKFDQAVADYSLVILLNPTFTEPYLQRALSYIQLKNNDAALVDLGCEHAEVRERMAAVASRLQSGKVLVGVHEVRAGNVAPRVELGALRGIHEVVARVDDDPAGIVDVLCELSRRDEDLLHGARIIAHCEGPSGNEDAR